MFVSGFSLVLFSTSIVVGCSDRLIAVVLENVCVVIVSKNSVPFLYVLFFISKWNPSIKFPYFLCRETRIQN